MGTGNGSGSRKPRRFLPTETKLAIVKAYLAGEGSAPELARVYGVFPTTVYTWLKRYKKLGEAGLEETKRASRRAPKPDPVGEKLAPEILETKKKFSWFGIPRIVQWLRRTKHLPVTETQVRKTLKRANLVSEKRRKRKRSDDDVRFERAQPNQLWQADITPWTLARGQRVYLIAFLDDYSRYIVGWGLFGAQGGPQVLEVFRNAIGQYGNPGEILTDQGRQFYSWRGRTKFEKEITREGIEHIVAEAGRPETKGKIEAFFKSIKDEFLSQVVSGSIGDLRERTKLWIESFYNFQRPHQGIGNAAPADRFFKIADAVRSEIEKGVRQNAERLALGKEPLKPFFLAGRMGDQAVVIRQEGSDVVVNVGDKELDKIRLSEDGHAEKAKPLGEAGDRKPGSEGQSPGGSSGTGGGEVGVRDLPRDGAPADPVLQARDADPQGDGDGCRGESRQGPEEKPAPGVEGSRGEKPEAPTGGAADAVLPPPQPEAVQGDPPGKEAGPQEGKTAEDGGRDEDGTRPGERADS